MTKQQKNDLLIITSHLEIGLRGFLSSQSPPKDILMDKETAELTIYRNIQSIRKQIVKL